MQITAWTLFNIRLVCPIDLQEFLPSLCLFPLLSERKIKWPLSATIHPYAKFPKYRDFGPTGVFPIVIYENKEREVTATAPQESVSSQRLHMLF